MFVIGGDFTTQKIISTLRCTIGRIETVTEKYLD
jgi:hypothetical protein